MLCIEPQLSHETGYPFAAAMTMTTDRQIVEIETPEHFQLRMPLAGIGSRGLAFFVDKCIQYGSVLLIILLFILWMRFFRELADLGHWISVLIDVMGDWALAAAILLYGIITLGYFIIFEYLWSGSTPGKKVQGIRVIRIDGRPVTLFSSTIRNIVRAVDILGDLYPIGLVPMFIDSNNRRLGDFAAGTVVIMDGDIYDPSVEERPVSDSETSPEARSTAINMTTEDYTLVSRFLERRGSLDEEYRRELGRKIHMRLFKDGRSGEPDITTLERELEAAAAEYRNKTRIL
jgi:uncharacterized RDD family membrane protein YckC